ncbi:M16 family metallopeptidase [Nocardiopsis sp. NPDC101807]|uniref:M16 family metallopeptidase n=1 Tax=Nocardiopsis sp. NPDC101807 TaxID=3364339 RepID=UPI0038182BB5
MSTVGSKRLGALTVVDSRLRTTSLCLATDYGAWGDPRGQEGIAHLLEHLLIYTPLRGGHSLSDRVSRRGGYCNAETHADGMVFSVQVHPDDADLALELMLEAVFAPSVDEASLERERQAVLRELAALETDPSDLVQRTFAQRVLGDHPLACPVGGTPASVERLSIGQTLEAHGKLFLDSEFTLVSVGPRAPDAVRTTPGTPEPGGPVRPEPPSTDLSRPWEPPHAWTGDFVWMCVGSAAPPAGSPRRPAFNVLEFMLGSRSTSLLNRALRVDRSLAYVFEAWYRGYSERGTWSVIVGAEAHHGEDILRAVRDCLADVAAGRCGEDFFDVARKQAVMQLVRGSESPFDWALHLAREAKSGVLGRDVGYETSRLEGVTFEDVRRAAQDILAGLTVVVETEA